MSVEIIAEYLIVHKIYPNRKQAFQRAAELMDFVGLARRHATVYPTNSTEVVDRIGIAGPFGTQSLLFVMNLFRPWMYRSGTDSQSLMDIQEERGLTYMFIP